mmetsp:Transcript_2493/g.5918  ORF Transcript_2493/g.5918 Transcript_2493/m.5918 type:complete len:208 (-) Transcript_2493:336-959(-)
MSLPSLIFAPKRAIARMETKKKDPFPGEFSFQDRKPKQKKVKGLKSQWREMYEDIERRAVAERQEAELAKMRRAAERAAERSREATRKQNPRRREHEQKMKLEQERIRQRNSSWENFETQWREFALNPPATISISDIPWPDVACQSAFQDDDHDWIRSISRTAVLLWHEDKFMQKFGNRLLPADVRPILLRCNALYQLAVEAKERVS